MNLLKNTDLNKPKIIFIDIDGTIYDKKTHEVSESTLKTLKKLRKNNIKLILCTARSKMEATNVLPILSDLVDGVCYLSGGDIEIESFHLKTKLSENDTFWLIDFFDKENLLYKYVDMNGTDYLLRPCEKIQQGFIRNYNWIPECKQYEREELLQILVFIENDVQAKFAYEKVEEATFVIMKNVIEITGKDCNKKEAILKVCKYFDIEPKSCASIGDGIGDSKMFEVTYGIAMGNANEKVKHMAKYVTKTIDEEGFTLAMQNHKWI